MSNIHLRGLDAQLVQRLKKTAADQKMSVNSLILAIIRQNLGLATKLRVPTFHDLDKLAGTWTADEAKEFTKNTADFEQIDENLWK